MGRLRAVTASGRKFVGGYASTAGRAVVVVLLPDDPATGGLWQDGRGRR